MVQVDDLTKEMFGVPVCELIIERYLYVWVNKVLDVKPQQIM